MTMNNTIKSGKLSCLLAFITTTYINDWYFVYFNLYICDDDADDDIIQCTFVHSHHVYKRN